MNDNKEMKVTKAQMKKLLNYWSGYDIESSKDNVNVWLPNSKHEPDDLVLNFRKVGKSWIMSDHVEENL